MNLTGKVDAEISGNGDGLGLNFLEGTMKWLWFESRELVWDGQEASSRFGL